MDEIENRQVINRCWPTPKPMTLDEAVDEYTREAMYRDWDWFDDLGTDGWREIAIAAVHCAYRGDYKDDAERMADLRSEIEPFITGWAENEAEAQ